MLIVNCQLSYQRNIAVAFEVVSVNIFVFNAVNIHTRDSVSSIEQGAVPADGWIVAAEYQTTVAVIDNPNEFLFLNGFANKAYFVVDAITIGGECVGNIYRPVNNVVLAQ